MKRVRKPFIVGNWKMNKNMSETSSFLNELMSSLSKYNFTNSDVGVAPVFTSLYSAQQTMKGRTPIKLCAQNAHWDDSGQFTGEISASMLKEIGVEYVIIGHSERRKFFGETDDTVNTRTKASLKAGLKVILCIGETLEQREGNITKKVITDQIAKDLKDISENDLLHNIVIAYEPVWAIGTGKNATVEQAVEVHMLIRSQLDTHYSKGTGQKVRILYGGSVKPDNIDGFMASNEIDGALVGGASLKIDSFVRIAGFKEE